MNRMIFYLRVAALLALSAQAFCATMQQRYESFESALKAGKLDIAEQQLQEWQKASPAEAELQVAWANLYMAKGMQSPQMYQGERNDRNVVPGQGGAFALTKEGTSETLGFLDARPRYDDKALTRALAALRDALTSYPQRTDIWMGATHIQLLSQNHNGAYQTLQQFGNYVHDHPVGLRTRLNQPLKQKASVFISNTLHDYAVRGFDEGTTAGREFLLRVAQLSQRLYPNHPYAYNDEAAYYNYIADDNKVLECLEKAHKVSPKDALVTMNIAATYKNMHQPEKAREYFNTTIKLATDPSLKAAAREELEALKEAKKN